MLKKLLCTLKRIFMQLSDKDYAKNKIKKRAGKCRKCGQCCRSCWFLGKDNLCRTYKSRPWLFCHKDFPLDKQEQEAWNVRNCGYRFLK